MTREDIEECRRWVKEGIATQEWAAAESTRCAKLIDSVCDAALLSLSERKPIALPADANGKRPRLFYFEETENCWCPAEGLEVENIISADNFLSNGEIVEIQFKREDMTDADFDAIPEG